LHIDRTPREPVEFSTGMHHIESSIGAASAGNGANMANERNQGESAL
jgi:hypothetical protein